MGPIPGGSRNSPFSLLAAAIRLNLADSSSTSETESVYVDFRIIFFVCVKFMEDASEFTYCWNANKKYGILTQHNVIK